MARPKPTIRRVLTGRYLTWAGARLAVRMLPALSNLLHFYPRGVAALDAADRILDNNTWWEALPFSGELRRFVIENCSHYDKATSRYQPGQDAEFFRRAVVIRCAEIQGSTGSVVLPSRSATVTVNGGAPNWNFARPRFLRTDNRITGLAIHSSRTNNYYHFLVENALPILDALERYHIDNATVIHYGQSKVQNDFYETLAKIWSGLRVYTIRDNESVSIDEVLFLVSRTANAEWAPIARSMAERLAEVFRIAYGLPSPGRASRRIFLSRSNAKIRRLTNEAELIEIARQRGFEPFVAHDGNHREQVGRFAEASHIIAVHGAGLANLIFAPKGARVLEIFPENFTKSTFAWMAARLGLDYQWIVGSKGNYDQIFSLDREIFSVALDRLLDDIF
jgi:Capsular polysaccharide biosynthesis protein